MPRLSVNFAISADGKITTVNRIPSGWTSQADFQRLLMLRKTADALLIGRGTLDADQMTMTVPGATRQPLRCIVSRHGRLNPNHPIFAREGGEIHLLTPAHVDSMVPASVARHHGSLSGFLNKLSSEYDVRHVHCEGGGELVRSLAQEDLIDEIHLTWAGHALFSGRDAPTLTGIPADFLPSTLHFKLTHFEPRPEAGECFLSWSRSR